MVVIKESFTFDDLMLIPKYSAVKSRSEVDTSVDFGKGFKFSHPLIPANMKDITGPHMARAIAKSGGLAILHRFMPFEDQLEILNQFVIDSTTEGHPNYVKHIGYSVGAKEEDKKKVDSLIGLGAEIICIDIAHGHSKMCLEMCNYITTKYPNVLLIAGNVATNEGAEALWLAGADCVKCGVGSGTICLTRVNTGNGVPQMSILMEVAKVQKNLQYAAKHGITPFIDKPNKRVFSFIADGGIRSSGDCAKALTFSTAIMAGGIFSGTDETPGTPIEINGKFYKDYNGSSTYKSNYVEGVKALVPVKSKVQDVLKSFLEGIRSACSYQGVNNLKDLKKEPEFVKMSRAGLIESGAHDVIVK